MTSETDREALLKAERERCAKVADGIAARRRMAQHGNIGNRTCADEAEGASAVAQAIRALSDLPYGGD